MPWLPSLRPLVEPEVGFSPFRLTDDLHPMRLGSAGASDLTFPFPSIACHWPYSGSRTAAFTLFLHRALRPSPTTCDLGKRPRLGMTLRSSRCQRRFLHIEHESEAPSRRRVGASSARTLLCEPAPSLLIEKGNC
jgi:hypothetical protein